MPIKAWPNLMEQVMFNKEAFAKLFEAAIIAIAGAEKVTKATLQTLSRDILTAHHETQDVGFINRLIGVLSPVNRKVAVLYFETFSGFKYNAEKKEFTSKNKKTYDDALKASLAFLEDPLNNIWSWADREVAVEAKEFDLARLKKSCESLVKKVKDNQLPEMAILENLLEAGLSMDTLIGLMAKIEGKPMPEKAEPAAAPL